MSRPELSVVIVAEPEGFVERTIHALRVQTAANRIEAIVVAAQTPGANLSSDPGAGLAAGRLLRVATCVSSVAAAAMGVRAAAAPVVALLEDHAFPEPNWAESLLHAHTAGWDVVGSAISNGNPEDGTVSWAVLLIGYGDWVAPVTAREVDDLPQHNVSYKRALLTSRDGGLEELLARESRLHDDLRSSGCRFFLTDAEVRHVNPSRLGPALRLRFHAGRLYGARRAERGRWTPARRFCYVAGSPLIPAVRLVRLRRRCLRTREWQALWPRILPASLACFLADALGQAAGYAVGSGDSPARLARLETRRARAVSLRERVVLGDVR